jgi:phosphohistidine phosphatase
VKLYLVQHGEAVPKAENPKRPLSERGHLDVEHVAAFAHRAGVRVHQIRHSGKRRAQETAKILGAELEPPGGVVALPGLGPKDDVRPTAELLNREIQPIMLVGHRPFMDRLAGWLVAGDRNRSVVRFYKGGIVCLERDPQSGEWAVVWAVTPGLFPE